MTDTISVTSRDVEVAGLSLHVNELGSGEPLVLLHHSTGPLWGKLHDELARSAHVIAVDLPGYGQSARPSHARSPRDLAIYISQLLDVLELDRVHLVGFGFGGWTAAELATMNQRALTSLTLVGAAGIKPRTGFIHDPLMNGFIEYMRVGFSRDDLFDEVFGTEPAQELINLWDYSREMTTRLTWKQWMWNLSLPHLLQGVNTPTLLIWGEQDRVVPLDCAEQYAHVLPHARLETVAGAGHLVELEQPESVARLIAGAVTTTR